MSTWHTRQHGRSALKSLSATPLPLTRFSSRSAHVFCATLPQLRYTGNLANAINAVRRKRRRCDANGQTLKAQQTQLISPALRTICTDNWQHGASECRLRQPVGVASFRNTLNHFFSSLISVAIFRLRRRVPIMELGNSAHRMDSGASMPRVL